MASALAHAHILGQERLREIAKRGVGAAWQNLGAYDRENVAPFLAQALPLVLAIQKHSANLTDAYLARALGRQPFGLDYSKVTGAAVRNGTPPEEVYHRSFVTVWAALKNGTQWQDAVAQGLHRATSTAEMDVQLAMRGTLGEVERADSQLTGYQRVADGGACDFCLEVDGAFLTSGDAMPLHNHCGCSVEPLTDSFTPTPLPDTVAVEDHGELGALLTDPADHFTQL